MRRLKWGDRAENGAGDEQKHFYDKLHISPLKVGRATERGDGMIKMGH